MAGNEFVRFCSHCSKTVNNLDELTFRQAYEIAQASEGKICVRYVSAPGENGPRFARGIRTAAVKVGLAAGTIGIAAGAFVPAMGNISDPVTITRSVSHKPTSDNGGRIFGTITDPQDAAIPFALVSLIQVGIGEIRVANASAEGQYEFTDLPAGRYLVKVSANGFAAGTTYEFDLDPDSEIRRDLRLSLEAVILNVDVINSLPSYKNETFATVGIVAISVVYNPLVTAVIDGDLEEVKARVAMGAKINVREKGRSGMSPLHFAVQNGDMEITRFLLERGAKVNLKDKSKRTPLMMIDEDATPDLVQMLINYGGKLNIADAEGKTVLHHAVVSGATAEVIRMLVAFGADPNAVDGEGNTPLMAAAESDSGESLRILLELGADASRVNRDGKTAAMLTNSSEIRDLLMAYGQARQ